MFDDHFCAESWLSLITDQADIITTTLEFLGDLWRNVDSVILTVFLLPFTLSCHTGESKIFSDLFDTNVHVFIHIGVVSTMVIVVDWKGVLAYD